MHLQIKDLPQDIKTMALDNAVKNANENSLLESAFLWLYAEKPKELNATKTHHFWFLCNDQNYDAARALLNK